MCEKRDEMGQRRGLLSLAMRPVVVGESGEVDADGDRTGLHIEHRLHTNHASQCGTVTTHKEDCENQLDTQH